jgi:2'-5' RNA ligase
MVRLFVAIPLPELVRQQLALTAGGLPGARWTPVENFHLTLRFVGEVDHGTADDLVAALDLIDAPRFQLTLAGVDHFKTGDKARVLWAGVEREPQLSRLHDKVEAACVRIGLAPEPRRFAPHVTLAKLREAPADRLAAFFAAHYGLRIGPIPVDRMVLYSSWRQATGALYTEEASFPLADD